MDGETKQLRKTVMMLRTDLARARKVAADALAEVKERQKLNEATTAELIIKAANLISRVISAESNIALLTMRGKALTDRVSSAESSITALTTKAHSHVSPI